eukprot:TRINITY_DN82493_c0_g1_i1.p1 TRINITY_DN82493_c0_g1~~TRINITY_DN82493_c0_g1_i1.p1  ORF type:complete len:335 (+),score=43.40 TRINITY_DN82493_c0_g1_i1:84-1088(+)
MDCPLCKEWRNKKDWAPSQWKYSRADINGLNVCKPCGGWANAPGLRIFTHIDLEPKAREPLVALPNGFDEALGGLDKTASGKVDTTASKLAAEDFSATLSAAAWLGDDRSERQPEYPRCTFGERDQCPVAGPKAAPGSAAAWLGDLPASDDDDARSSSSSEESISYVPDRQPSYALDSRPKDSLPLVVIDMQNVARKAGERWQRFYCRGIQAAVLYYQRSGYKVVGFLPHYIFHTSRTPFYDPKKQPDDLPLLLRLRDAGVIHTTPAQDHDDDYIVGYATTKDATVVSNDMFRDWCHKSDNPEASFRWVQEHVCSYTFVDDDFVPNPAFARRSV